jgi:ribonucleoside-diphosphate reductase alpha subunit
MPFRRTRLLAFLGGKVASGLAVDPKKVVWQVVAGLTPGISTRDLSDLVVESASYLASVHPDYSKYAGRMAMHFFEQGLPSLCRTFSGATQVLLAHGAVSAEYASAVSAEAELLDEAVQTATEAGLPIDDFGFKTLFRSYFLRVDNEPVETPAYLYMRAAVGIHGTDTAAALETFRALVAQEVSHATPTLFFAGTRHPQMSSCFLLDMEADSIEGIFSTLSKCALISKFAGGIGLAVHKIRGSGSSIRSTNGRSNGLVPMARVFSDTARYVDQGGGKRKGAFALYLEPWHSDVFAWLDLKKNHGKEEVRARDLFYALWVPDLFMKRVMEGGKWSLFCPDEAPGLHLVHGAAFEALYTSYEAQGRAKRVVDASLLWRAILESIIETGSPFVLFKDACNEFSNHRHLGTIQSSNLCTEIIQYTSPTETAVCNLAAVVLDTCVRAHTDAPPEFDFDKLGRLTALLVRNLNKVIDRNFYPVPEAAASNRRNRPIGIGVVGLADTFAKLGMAYGDEASMALNRDIFETMYYSAMEASVELAIEHGPYATYEGSPLSEGKFQFDLMGVAVDDSRHDWTALRARVLRHGARNSLLLAVMPTASTAQIISRQESHEPFFSMMYSRRVLAGDFPVVNRHLVAELEALGLWTADIRAAIVQARGSVATIDAIPQAVRDRFATAFEIRHRVVLQMAADRQPFICQGQSLNAHIADPTFEKLTSMLFFAWSRRLKNGVYYTRSKPASNPVQLAHMSSGSSGSSVSSGSSGSGAAGAGVEADFDAGASAVSVASDTATSASGPNPAECVACAV